MALTNSTRSDRSDDEENPHPGEFAVFMVVMIISGLFFWNGFVTAFTPLLAPLLRH